MEISLLDLCDSFIFITYTYKLIFDLNSQLYYHIIIFRNITTKTTRND